MEAAPEVLQVVIALVAGIALAWSGQSLFVVAVASCLTVFLSEFFL